METNKKNIQQNRDAMEDVETVKQLRRIEGIAFIILIVGTLLISLMLHVLFTEVTILDVVLLILIALLCCLFIALYTDNRVKSLRKDDQIDNLGSDLQKEQIKVEDSKYEELQEKFDDLAKRYADLRNEKAKLQEEKLQLQVYIRNNEGNDKNGN